MIPDESPTLLSNKIVVQGAAMRCHVCGNPNIVAVCHHCGKPMCSDHGPVHPIMRWFTENREFTHLSFDSWPLQNTSPAHCSEHVHSSPNYRRIMIIPGIIILLIGLWYTLQGIVNTMDCLGRRPEKIDPGQNFLSESLRDPGIYSGLEDGICYRPELSGNLWYLLQFGMIVLFGAATTGVGFYLNRERISADLAGWRPPVPLGPVSNRLEVVESLSAHLSLTPEGRTVFPKVEVNGGKLFAQLRLTPADQSRLDEYRRKYGLSSNASIDFHAGFLGFAGQPRIEVNFPPEKIPATNLIILDGKVDEQPYLSGSVGSSNPVCLESLEYKVFLGEASEENWIIFRCA